MKTTNILTLLALLAIETCLASAPTRIVEVEARQASAPYITFYFEGAFVSYGLYADFRQSVPEDGKTYPITNTTVVYSIIPNDTTSNCTFIGTDGSINIISGSQRDIPPIQLASVTCSARTGPIATLTDFPNLTSFFPPSTSIGSATPMASTKSVEASTTASSITVTESSASPSYPIPTGASSGVLDIGSSVAAAAPGVASGTGGRGESTGVPFTGDANRMLGSVGFYLFAFLGAVVTLQTILT